MSKTSFLGATSALALSCCFAGCGGSGGGGRPARNSALTVSPSLVRTANDFGFRLYRRLAEQDSGKNVFLSPASIELALAMTYNGAGGTSKTGMAEALGIGALSLEDFNAANRQLLALLDNPDPKVDLLIANALWTQEGLTFDPGFLQRNQESYQATVQGVNFRDPATAVLINRWASDHTRGIIKEIVTPADIAEDLIQLTNAVYFKGPWTEPFDPAETRDGPFTRQDGTTKTVPMMSKSEEEIDYFENDLFQAARLSYGGKFLSMTIVLPKPGLGLSDVAAQLTSANWADWSTQYSPRGIYLQLPRFKAEYKAELKNALSDLGMADAFDASVADFSAMFAPGAALPGNVFLTHVLHKTYLSVDEKGTTAAAVTSVGGGAASAPPSMIVNRPFVVAISDGPTGVILFLGSITDPQ